MNHDLACSIKFMSMWELVEEHKKAQELATDRALKYKN